MAGVLVRYKIMKIGRCNAMRGGTAAQLKAAETAEGRRERSYYFRFPLARSKKKLRSLRPSAVSAAFNRALCTVTRSKGNDQRSTRIHFHRRAKNF
jgi:hypothetical protein